MTNSFRQHSLLMALGLLLGGGLQAQIRTDVSLGQPAQNLTGPMILIPQSLGKLAGNNLFHSFQTFNLASGEVANFTTTSAGLANVISRVTGGEASQINGAMRLSAAGGTPAFFFINPAGVTFGAGASIHVPGAFHVSTADYLKFPDGRFQTDVTQTSTFSTAPPEAFGYLGTARASIAIRDGAALKPQTDFPISVVAGDILIDGGLLGAKGGAVHAIAVGGVSNDIALVGSIPLVTGTLRVDNGGQIATINSGTATPPGQIILDAGDIVMANGGNISSFNASSGQAGEIALNARRVALQSDAYVFSTAQVNGSGDGANIRLTASDSIAINGGVNGQTSVSTATFSAGNAGHILIQADNIRANTAGYVSSDAFDSSTGNTGSITLDAVDTMTLSGRSKVYVSTAASGSAGTVKLKATDITIGSGSYVSSVAFQGSANAGDVEIRAGNTLSLRDDAAVISSSTSTGNAGNLRISAQDIVLDNTSKIASPAFAGTGNAGSVDVSALGTLSLRHGSAIDSSTASAGRGGNIMVAAANMTIDQESRISSIALEGSGHAGKIEVRSTNQLTLSNDGSITSATSTQGNAGSVLINANTIDLQSGGHVSTATLSAGNAGRISVKASGTVAVSTGFVSSSTFGAGRADSIDVSAPVISLAGPQSYVSALAAVDSSGQTGAITLSASDSIHLKDGAQLLISNYAAPASTSNLSTTALSLTAPSIILRGNALVSSASTGNVSAGHITIDASKQLDLAGSRINTIANDGNGGRITIRAGDLMLLNQSRISTSVSGSSGNGGDIQVKANSLILNQGFIQANTAANQASGGLINLDLRNLVASGSTLFVGGQSAYEYVPGLFGFNVVQAAAPTGISGAIQITSPVLDLSGSLGRLGAQVLDTGGLGRNLCDVSGGSSLVLAGQGGMPVSYRDLLRAKDKPESAKPTFVPVSSLSRSERVASWTAGCP